MAHQCGISFNISKKLIFCLFFLYLCPLKAFNQTGEIYASDTVVRVRRRSEQTLWQQSNVGGRSTLLMTFATTNKYLCFIMLQLKLQAKQGDKACSKEKSSKKTKIGRLAFNLLRVCKKHAKWEQCSPRIVQPQWQATPLREYVCTSAI